MLSVASAADKPVLAFDANSYVLPNSLITDDPNAISPNPSPKLGTLSDPGGSGRLQRLAHIYPNGLLPGNMTVSGTFTKASFLGQNLQICGTLTNSTGSSIKIGVCYYNYTQGIYIAQFYKYIASGQYENDSIAVANLYDNIDYRGFVNNTATSGNVSGELYFWDYGPRR